MTAIARDVEYVRRVTVSMPAWIESQLPGGARHAMVDVGGDQRMHVAEWGPADGRAVLLVHGNPTWSFLWRKVVAAVRARPEGETLRLVAPDLIGLGLSTKPSASAHSLDHHAGWLGRMIDQRVAGPLVLVAQDWGGPTGLCALATRRERLRGIVLGNTAVGPPREGFKPTLFHRLSQLPVVSHVLFRELGFPLGVLHFSQGDRASIRGDVARAYRWPLRRWSARAAPLALARMVPDSLRHPSVPALRVSDELFQSVQVPISIVWGTKDPVLGRVINHLERVRPDAKVVRDDGAGHFLQEEVPELLADAILDVTSRATWT
jgi:haloalkane dehalogenase